MEKVKLFENILKEEIEKIENTKKDFEERYVKRDVEEFIKASSKMLQLYKGEVEEVIYNFNMWEVAHDSLDRVIKHFELKEVIVDEKDYYIKFTK